MAGKGKKLSYRDSRRLNKLLKDDEIQVISKGRIIGPSRKTREVVFREQLIRECMHLPLRSLVELILKELGQDLEPYYVSKIRSRLRKEENAR